LWFPVSPEPLAAHCPSGDRPPTVAVSRDLGIVKLDAPASELILRTRSELTSWDRRYLGPTILRYECQGRLLVGAISRTVSTDAILRPRIGSRARKAWTVFRDRFVNGIEQLDGTSVGFLPVLRRGHLDYLPYQVVAHEASPERVRSRYEMARLHAKGWRPCVIEAVALLSRNLPLVRPKRYTPPPVKPVRSLTLERDVYMTPHGCRIEDRVSGDLRGMTLLFSVRRLPGASIRVRGLTLARSATGWGSDGRHTLELYEGRAAGSEIRYECDIQLAERD
jgi:hypothetical protein